MHKTFIAAILGGVSLMATLNVQAEDIPEYEAPPLDFRFQVLPAIQSNEWNLELEGKKWDFQFHPKDFADFANEISLDHGRICLDKGCFDKEKYKLSILYIVKHKLSEEQSFVSFTMKSGGYCQLSREYSYPAQLILTRQLSGEEVAQYSNLREMADMQNGIRTHGKAY